MNALAPMMTELPPDAPSPRISMRVIISVTASFYEVSVGDILSHRRDQDITIVRQIAMYAIRLLTPRSFPEIGLALGGRDHTTAMHGVKKVEARIAGGGVFATNVHALIDYLRRVAASAPSVDADPFEAAERLGRDPKHAVNVSLDGIRAMAAIVRAAKAEAIASMVLPEPSPEPIIFERTALERELRDFIETGLLLERASPGQLKSATERHAKATAILQSAAEMHFNIKRSPK